MVSADSLNLDVLELIFAYLSGRDLPSVALVSRSFLAGVIPRLYRTLSFRIHHAKRYPRVTTSFQSILAHPALAVHVRHIDIRSVPLLSTSPSPFPSCPPSTFPTSSPHPLFMRTLTSALKLTTNLQSLTYTPDTGSLPTLLPYLADKKRLESLRVCAARVTGEQAEMLLKVRVGGGGGSGRLALESASWAVVGVLPRWVGGPGGIARGLGVLTLYMCTDLNEGVLESTLQHLPHLIGLHVIGCPRVNHATVLKLTVHTPLLESLALTCSDTPLPLPTSSPPLYALRSLALEARPQAILAVLAHLRASFPPLVSIALKMADLGGEAGGNAGGVGGGNVGGAGAGAGNVGVGNVGVGNPPHLPNFNFGGFGNVFVAPNANANANTHPTPNSTVEDRLVNALVEGYAGTLERLWFVESGVGIEPLGRVCEGCVGLEVLGVGLPGVRGLMHLTTALARSATLNTLVDVDAHTTHGPHPGLAQDGVRCLMRTVCGLRRVISGGRVWTGHTDATTGKLVVEFEKQSAVGPGRHWFMPPGQGY